MTRCFAVGFTYNDAGTETRTLVERWSGHGWVIVPTPNRGSLNNTLYGIACLSPTRCRADGYSKVGSSNVTLLERWNGAGWGIVGTPNVAGSQNAVIEGMSCAGGMLCVATGVTTHGSSGRSLVEEAVGDGPWAIVPSANVAGAANEVIGVSCPWAAQCFAADQVSTPSRGLVGILESR